MFITRGVLKGDVSVYEGYRIGGAFRRPIYRTPPLPRCRAGGRTGPRDTCPDPARAADTIRVSARMCGCRRVGRRFREARRGVPAIC